MYNKILFLFFRFRV